jgi:hypothetical protein
MPPHKASRKPTRIHVPKKGALAKIADRDGLDTIALLWSLLREEIRQRPRFRSNVRRSLKTLVKRFLFGF